MRRLEKLLNSFKTQPEINLKRSSTKLKSEHEIQSMNVSDHDRMEEINICMPCMVRITTVHPLFLEGHLENFQCPDHCSLSTLFYRHVLST